VTRSHASSASTSKHNISAAQVPDQYGDLFYLDDPIGGVCMNVFKAGVILAHRIIAVSHG